MPSLGGATEWLNSVPLGPAELRGDTVLVNDRVRQATKERDIDYPVAVDNDYAIWSTFANHYWPALEPGAEAYVFTFG
jgi:hypothetical protein